MTHASPAPRFLRFSKTGAACLALMVAAVNPLPAVVTGALLFTDHMVLQRDQPLPVWGKADPGETVTVIFGSQSRQTTADLAGNWRVTLAPAAVNASPQQLVFEGDANRVTLTDVLVGEVWFCSGQSNMEKPLGPRIRQMPTDNYEAEIARSARPLLRLFQVPHSNQTPKGPGESQWLPCSPASLVSSDFSAAAYYFGRDLQEALAVPVGLIHSSFGGTRIEAWMAPESFDREPLLRGLEHIRYHAWVPGVQPVELYDSMVRPFVPYALRGFLWYQGEQNVQNSGGQHYTVKMRELITSWRAAWAQPDAPFYYALIAPFPYSERIRLDPSLTPNALPAFWEDQIRARDIPHTGLLVTHDLTPDINDIHPTNKRDVGNRFARLALAHTYGRADIVAEGPRFIAMQPADTGGFDLTFAHADGLRSRDGAPLTGFAIAGADQHFHQATAEIQGSTIHVSSLTVSDPVAVRFAWNETATPNLENGAGLPAEPFRTDDWIVIRAQPVTVP